MGTPWPPRDVLGRQTAWDGTGQVSLITLEVGILGDDVSPSRTKALWRILVAAGGAAVFLSWPRPSRGPLAELTAALDGTRALAPRLTGGFAHAPCPPAVSPLRCAATPRPATVLRPARGRIVRGLETAEAAGATADALQARALLELVDEAPDLDLALHLLERAHFEDPTSAPRLTDLATAHLLRAEVAGGDLVRALELVERALELTPKLEEALFNRALILESLHLGPAAAAAWEAFEAAAEPSPWTREAAERRAALARTTLDDAWDRALAELRDAEDEGTEADEIVLRRLVELSPYRTIGEVLVRIQPRWAAAELAGERERAAAHLSTVRRLGTWLQDLAGDATVAELARAIDAASAEPASVQYGALTAAHARYGEARGEPPAAAVAAFEAARDLLPAASPLRGWIELDLARLEFRRLAFADAARRLAPPGFAVSEDLPVLAGYGSWLEGMAWARQGRYLTALGSFRRMLDALAPTGEGEGLAMAYTLTAETAEILGRPHEAWSVRQRGLAAFGGASDSRYLHILLRDAAEAALEQGAPRAALVFQGEAVRSAAASGNASSLAESHLWRARWLGATGQADAARRDLAAARSASRGMASESERQAVVQDAGFMAAEIAAADDPHLSLKLYDDALALHRQRGVEVRIAAILLSRARVLRRLGRLEAAAADLAEGMEAHRRLRRRMGDVDDRLDVAEAAQALFDERIALEALDRRRPDLALLAHEEGRSIFTPLAGPGGALPWRRPDQLEMAAANALERLRGPLGEDEGALVYAAIGDHLLLWTLDARGIELHVQELGRGELERAIGRFVELAADRRELAAFATHATRLGAWLLEPLLERWPAGPPGRLVVVADGPLHAVPWAALRDPRTGRHLVEGHTITLAPSLTALLGRPREETFDLGAGALLVGRPAFDRRRFPRLAPLPDAAREITDLTALYPGSTVLTGPAATPERFLAALGRHPVVQFAGHAVASPRHPGASHLVLAPGDGDAASASGVLYARDLEAGRWPELRLVVLSACGTAVPSRRRMGGLHGLARPFLAGGARVVVGSLWNVDDAASRQLMTSFHRHLAAGDGVAEALRGAQLELLHGASGKFASPSAWAAFQLLGAWPAPQPEGG